MSLVSCATVSSIVEVFLPVMLLMLSRGASVSGDCCSGIAGANWIGSLSGEGGWFVCLCGCPGFSEFFTGCVLLSGLQDNVISWARVRCRLGDTVALWGGIRT